MQRIQKAMTAGKQMKGKTDRWEMKAATNSKVEAGREERREMEKRGRKKRREGVWG